MQNSIEEMDYQMTPIGEITLRRRRSPTVPDRLVYEVRVDHQMLMSSSVNRSECVLATLALDQMNGRPCDVLIGGLGLGYTAATALGYLNVRHLHVVELLAPIIGWHRDRLLPTSNRLVDDARCALIEGDFFEHVGPSTAHGWMRYDVILVDIDHAPESWLRPQHAAFYADQSLRMLAAHLRDDGIFALWSATEPGQTFMRRLRGVFGKVRLHEVPFFNPHMNHNDANWVIVAGLEDA